MSVDQANAPDGSSMAAEYEGPRGNGNSNESRTQVIKPNDNDILLGRGGKNNLHIGNEKLRELARSHCGFYRLASKKQKTEISRNLVRQIRSMVPPGRFLRRNASTGRWEEAGDAVAKEKAGQVLRDALNQYHPSVPLGGSYMREERMGYNRFFNQYEPNNWHDPPALPAHMIPSWIDRRSDTSQSRHSLQVEHHRDPAWPQEPPYINERKRAHDFDEPMRPSQRRRPDPLGIDFDDRRRMDTGLNMNMGLDISDPSRLNMGSRMNIGINFNDTHRMGIDTGVRMDVTNRRTMDVEMTSGMGMSMGRNNLRQGGMVPSMRSNVDMSLNGSRFDDGRYNDSRRLGTSMSMGMGIGIGFNDHRRGDVDNEYTEQFRMGRGIEYNDQRRETDTTFGNNDIPSTTLPELPPIPPARQLFNAGGDRMRLTSHHDSSYPQANSFASNSSSSTMMLHPNDFRSQPIRLSAQYHFGSGTGSSLPARPQQFGDNELFGSEILSDNSDQGPPYSSTVV